MSQPTGTDASSNEEVTEEALSSRFESLLSEEESSSESKAAPARKKEPKPDADEDTESTDSKPEDEEEAEEESEEVEEENPDEEVEQPTLYTVKVNGEDVQVTLEEALKGYSRQKDYTQKTQEVSAKAKQYEAEQASLHSERQQYADGLRQMEQALTELTPAEPDWPKIQDENPTDFPIIWAQWQQHKERLVALRQERERADFNVSADKVNQFNKTVAAERERLYEVIPAWRDTVKRDTDMKELREYAKEVGYSDEDIAMVADHRAILLLRKSMLLDRQEKAKPKIKKRIEEIKKASPGAAQNKGRIVSDTAKALTRLAKSGSVEDAGLAFGTMLDSDS